VTSSGSAETHLTLEAPKHLCFGKSLRWLTSAYAEICREHGLSPETAAFTRFYLSDITNQAQALRGSPLVEQVAQGAISLIQQRPLGGSQIAMHAYHVEGRYTRARTPWRDATYRNSCTLDGSTYRMHIVANCADNSRFDAGVQTVNLLRDFNETLNAQTLSLRDSTVRTWVYVRDIDNHYKGMVDARREYFVEQGLTRSTRYIASTGIEGIGAMPGAVVSFDALSFGNLRPEQVVRMEALDHMPPTITYGVTFERGLRVRFGDRSHLYISGTASIDADGKVLHEGDAVMQAGRMLENVRALLAEQGAGIADFAYVLLYLRNPADTERVLDIVRAALPAGVPLIVAHGAVCRPTWLVEMEGLALIGDRNGIAPFL